MALGLWVEGKQNVKKTIFPPQSCPKLVTCHEDIFSSLINFVIKSPLVDMSAQVRRGTISSTTPLTR